MKIICPNPEDFSDEILSYLKKYFYCTFKKITQENLDKNLSNYDAILTRFNHRVKYFKQNKLLFIISPTTGLDHIDKRYFNSNTKIISLTSETKFLKRINASAEFTIYLILKALKSFKFYNNNFYREIYAKKIGIVGYGRIGKKIYPILKKMGAKVFINDVNKSIVPEKVYKPINELIKQSEIISFNIPLNSKNKCIINKKKIDLIKNNTLIINTSRGEIFDEKALFNKLKRFEIYYATDVMGKFMLKDFRYKKMKKKIIYTKHIAGLTNESVKMTDNFVLKKFLRLL